MTRKALPAEADDKEGNQSKYANTAEEDAGRDRQSWPGPFLNVCLLGIFMQEKSQARYSESTDFGVRSDTRM